jgi:hypothetical protein
MVPSLPVHEPSSKATDILQKNLGSIDFSVLLLGVMTIADEVDSQLSQAMKSYIAECVQDALPA